EPDLVNPSEGRPRMSRKMYLTGSRPDIRVPMRAIALSGGNPPLRLYDTSGPYTDPEAAIDLKRGLPPLRLAWILGRGDIEELPGSTSVYRKTREEDPALGGVRFASVRRRLLDRGGGREDDVGDALGRGHRHGSFDGQKHPRDPRVDPAQLAGAHRHGADLPGAREGRRQGRGAHLGGLPRHTRRAGGAGRR